MPVNREALLQKLEKMGISKKAMYLGNHVTLAVEEFVAANADYDVKADDQSFDFSDVEETIYHKCPKCEHEWKTEENFFIPSIEVDGSEIADSVEVVMATKGPSLAPGSLVLTAEEVEAMVLWYAGVV